MTKITLSLGGFFYRGVSLLEQLKIASMIDGVVGVELHNKHGYSYAKSELEILEQFQSNSIHLHGYEQKDKARLFYCAETLPHFSHAVLHPDIANVNHIDAEVEHLLSFENMDTRKEAYRYPSEMDALFQRFPHANFTLDINHAEENDVPVSSFDIVKKPKQIHFSIVNNDYYTDYPKIETTHALAIYRDNFNLDLTPYTDAIITCEGVYPPGKVDHIQQEVNLIRSLLDE